MRDAQDVDVLDGSDASRWTSRLPTAVGIAAVVVLIDQLTKRWALETLEAGPCGQTDACIDLIAGARLRLVFNNGAAFATGGDFGPLFGVLAFLMAFLLLYLAARQPRLRGLAPFAVIAGGAVGNLLDRFFRADDGFLSGAVVDFVDLGWWPVFNVADSAIVVGVIAVIVFTMLEPEPRDQQPDHDSDPDLDNGSDPVVGDLSGLGPDVVSGRAIGEERVDGGLEPDQTADEQPDEGEPSLAT